MAQAPFFSIIIPTCNRPLVLEQNLGTYAPDVQQPFAPGASHEVIVTDDSRDEAPQRQAAARFDWVRYVRGPRKGAGANRNAGAHAARGEWLVFLDDDCEVRDDFLAALYQCVQRTGAEVIEGKIVCPNKTGWPWRSEPENLTGGFFWSGNLAVKRSAFLAMGGFDDELGRGEDIYFGREVRARNLRTTFCAEAMARHPSEPLSPRQYFARVLSSRWQLMVRLKAGSVPSSRGWWTCFTAVIRFWIPLVLRQCWLPLRDAWCHRSKPRLTLICGAWLNVMYLPLMLPYLVFWERRFRSILMDSSKNPRATRAS